MSLELSYHLRNTLLVSNLILARKIEEMEGKFLVPNSKEFKKDKNNRKKAYQLFLRLIDPNSRESLLEIDKKVSSLCSKVTAESCWDYTDNRFTFMENSKIFHSPDIRVLPICVVKRTKDGFVPSSRGEFTDPTSLIISREEHFVAYFHDELEMIHELLTEKEKIMGGNYTLLNSGDKSLARSIANYLKFSSKTEEDEKKGFK